MIAKLTRLVFGQPLAIHHNNQVHNTTRMSGYLITLPKSYDDEVITPAVAVYKEALTTKESDISTPVKAAYQNHFGPLKPHILFAHDKSCTSTDTLRPFNGAGNRDTQYFTIAQLRKLRDMTDDLLENKEFTAALEIKSPEKLEKLVQLGRSLNVDKTADTRPAINQKKAHTTAHSADLTK